MTKYKYLLSFLLPIMTLMAILWPERFAVLPLTFMFFLVPLFELLAKPDKSNLAREEALVAENDAFFDNLLYAHVAFHLVVVYYYLTRIGAYGNPWQLAGVIVGVGILNGGCVINLGHEFCHRKGKMNQYLSELMLLTSLETHFRPYHLRCHHANAATENDPATARRGEWIYTFVFREQFTSYFQAWEAEGQYVRKRGKKSYSLHNRMAVYAVTQLTLLIGIYLVLGTQTVLAFLASSAIGMFTLACASYIEHYGILRHKKVSGRYEPLQLHHSWNSNHLLSRIVLFELARHPDHHYSPNKKYQVLDSNIESPQLPTGYPGSMILAFIPPLWFRVMNKRLDLHQQLFSPRGCPL